MPVFHNYVEDVLDGLSAEPGREVLVSGERRWGAEEFRSLVHRLARALRERGVGRGRAVTLLCGNLPETIAARYAVNLLGAPFNHLYNRLGPDVQAKMMTDVETHTLIVDPTLVDRAVQLTSTVAVDQFLTLGPTEVPEAEDLLALAAHQPDDPVTSQARPDDLCFIRHSGGTTGHPKGIRSTFARMLGLDQVSALFGGHTPRDLVCTPVSHAAGFIADATLAAGGTVVLHRTFDPGEVLATIERERITHLFLLPPLLYQVLDHPARVDTSSLRQLTYGGTPSSPTRIAEAARRFGPVLHQGYGQFESGPVSMLTAAEHDPDRLDILRTAGRVLPGVEVEIRDPDDAPVPAGQVGEICVRGGGMMEGYWKNPELTAEVMRGGWMHTGDLGRLDDHGYLTVVDRVRDMIVVVGGHVYTAELEEFLSTHPEVRDCAVYGVRGVDGVERIFASVVVRPGSAVTEEELRQMVSTGRGAMYVPDRVEFVAALPLTDVGKPDKKVLRGRAVG